MLTLRDGSSLKFLVLHPLEDTVTHLFSLVPESSYSEARAPRPSSEICTLSTQSQWPGIKDQREEVLRLQDSSTLQIWLEEPRWLSSEDGMETNSSTMFTCLTWKSWLGQSHQQLGLLHPQERATALFWLEPTWLSTEASGSTTRTWRKQEAKPKELRFKNAISTTSESLTQRPLFGLVWEWVAPHPSTDSATAWTFQDQISSCSVDGQRLQERDSSTSHQKRAVTISWYGLQTQCLGKEESILEILQQPGSDTRVQLLDPTCLSSEDGSTQKPKMK